MVSGTGTSGDPFILSSLSDLELIGTTGYALSAYYKLGANIDASGTSDPGYNSGAGWLPIGTGSYFNGSFDGDGYTISGLYINRASTDTIGLFGEVRTNNIINVTLTDCDITGQNNVGGVIGYLNNIRTTLNYSVSGTITGVNNVGGVVGWSYRGTHSYHDFTGTVTGSGDRVGGIIGFNDTYSTYSYNTEYCIANATINGVNRVGGICGNGEFTLIDNCEFTGIINSTGTETGGIIGNNEQKQVQNCSVTDITINSSSNFVGGIAGRIYRNSVYNCTVTNLTINGELSSYVGGVIGYLKSYSGSVQTMDTCIVTNATITGNDEVGGLGGYAENFSCINSEFDGDIVGVTDVGGVSGLSSGNTSTFIDGCTVKGSITASGDKIGGISGTKMGGIKNINIDSNLVISGSGDYIGNIVGYYNGAGVMENCTSSINVSGRDYVGGLIGGTANTGAIFTAQNCSYNGAVSGRNNVGGVFGFNALNNTSSLIENCYSSGSINGTGNYIGGFIGYAYVPISNCYSGSTVIGNSNVGGFGGYMRTRPLTSVYSSGSVTGSTDVGGLVGVQDSVTSTDCFWDTQTSGQATSALGTGKTTAEMKTQSTFTNWDFDTLWDITPMDGLEYLSGEESEILLGAMAVQPTPANVSLEGYDFSLLMGSGVIGAVGNLLISGLSGEVLVEMVIVAPSGEVFMSGINPYLPQEGDIELYDLTPKKIAKKFISYVKFKLKTPDDNAFLIKTAKAKMDNETIPIAITRNGTAVNTCQMTIDTNHLRDGWKKLDITIIIEGNSNQFRRYIRIL